MQISLFKSSRSKYIILFFIVFIVYILTLAPDTTPEDSGELAAAGFFLGIPHPPGYPLYILLAKLFTFLIPVKTVIFRINLFSAFFSSLTAVLLCHFVYKMSNSSFLSIILSLSFAFSRIVWSQSIVSEVYSLNLFCITLFLFITWKCFDQKKYLALLFFLAGLCIVSHYGNILVLAGVFIFMWKKYKKQLLSFRYIFWALFPLTLFFVLYIRSQANPPVDWGNPENKENFLFHVLRLSFGSMISSASRSWDLFFQQWKVLIRLYFYQYNSLMGIVILPLLIISWRKINKEWRSLLFLLMILTSLGVILLLNFRIDEEIFQVNKVFFLPFFLVLTISLTGIPLKNKAMRLILFLPLILLIQNFPYNNRSHDCYTRLYNQDLLKGIRYKYTLFSAKDFSTFPLLYYQSVEYLRPDIHIYDWFGNVFDVIFTQKDFHLLPDFKRDKIREETTDELRNKLNDEVFYSFQRDTLNKIKTMGLIYTYQQDLPPEAEINYFNFPLQATNDLRYYDYFVKNMISVYYFHLGFYYKQQGSGILTEKMFSLSDQWGGDKGKQLVNLAVNELKTGNSIQAKVYLEQAIRQNNTLYQAYFILGNLYFQENNQVKAEEMYLYCLSVNPLHGPAYNTLAELYLRQGNRQKAKEILLKGLSSNYGRLYSVLGVILIQENDLEGAMDHFKKGIELAPEDTSSYLNLSVALSKLNRWQEARQYLEQAYQINAEDKNILLNLSLVYLKTGEMQKAKNMLLMGKNKFPAERAFTLYYDQFFNK